MSTDSVHIASKRSYFAIFALLMVCTYLTWQVAFFDLGVFITVVAATMLATISPGVLPEQFDGEPET